MSSPSAKPSRPVEGMEVPIPGSDNIKWIELIVPPVSPQSTSSPPSEVRASSRPRSTGSCHVVDGDPPAYVVWRVHENPSNVLEIIELFPSKDFPERGLHLVFPDAIFPFSFICKNESGSVMIYALTETGVAYLFKLKSFYAYASGSIFPRSDIEAFNVQNHKRITAVQATFGCLIIGREDGSVSCYKIGAIDEGAPGFVHEIRDDIGMGRLWNLMSRGRTVAAVVYLVVHEFFGRDFLFVGHTDGSIRIWDLLHNTKVFNHSFSEQEVTGSLCRFWVSDANYDTRQFFLGVQLEGPLGSNFGTIALYCLNFDGEKLTLDPSVQYIPLDEGSLLDMKLTYDKLWLLKEEGPMLYNLSFSDTNMENECIYNLIEESIADKLFEGSENLFDDLVWANLSTFSSSKEQIPFIISSIFLRRLLQPGILLNSAVHATILDQKRFMSDHEVQSLTISSLKQELLSIIEIEGIATDLRSVVYYWKKISSHFFHHWCQDNSPYSLFIDPLLGGIGLIRKSSISLFRQLGNIEMVMRGSYDESHNIKHSQLLLPTDDLDCDILYDVLKCMRTVRHQLHRAAASVFYESLANPSLVSYEDTIFHLLKVLEVGHSSSLIASLASPVGDDSTREIKQTLHRNHRKFSIDLLLSLKDLHSKATTWGRVLDVIELYLKNMLPGRPSEHVGSKKLFSINSSLLVQATSQVSGVMFDCAFGMYMLLGYMVNINVQVQMTQNDLSRIRLELMPMIENIIMRWHLVHFITTTQTQAYTLGDFSSQLSSLHIDKNVHSQLWDGKLGTCGFTLACLLGFTNFPNEDGFITSSLLDPCKFVDSVWNFCGWAIWGKTDHGPHALWPSLEIACLFLQHGQYEDAENLLAVVDAYISRNKSQNILGDCGAWLHLLGYCLVVRGRESLNATLKEWKIRKAICCFFRVAAYGQGAFDRIQDLSFPTGFHCPRNSGCVKVWKYFYYQWVMQFFEQHNLTEPAFQFALSALEQVDEVLEDESSGSSTQFESPNTIKGQLWANVFKFAIDLGHYRDAYCAVISNPNEESKYICLRRFIIVLYEQGESKILCNGELPLVGLVEKVEQELVWKAERSDISSRPNLYKLLYAFQMHCNNWRKAATYMYHYSNRLKQEMVVNENLQGSFFEEVLSALSASINALQLVHPPHAWIDSQYGNYFCLDKSSPNKRPRKSFIENSCIIVDTESQRPHNYIDIETLEKEHVLLSAQYLLSITNVKYTISAGNETLFTTVDALIQANLYDMAFTLLLKFWKGTKLRRELERIFVAISQNCCLTNGNAFFLGYNMACDLIVKSDDKNFITNGKADSSSGIRQPSGYSQWELLETYLKKYRKLHPMLPVTVAETLLYNDPQIELPLWLVHMFKDGRRAASWGMADSESDPATLFRLYVDYSRYAEATDLLLEYLEAFASMRPADIINRKRMSAVCFPYVAIQRLWCHLEEAQSSGHMVDQCVRLKNLLGESMRDHVKQVKVDSDDALASASV